MRAAAGVGEPRLSGSDVAQGWGGGTLSELTPVCVCMGVAGPVRQRLQPIHPLQPPVQHLQVGKYSGPFISSAAASQIGVRRSLRARARGGRLLETAGSFIMARPWSGQWAACRDPHIWLLGLGVLKPRACVRVLPQGQCGWAACGQLAVA